MRSNETVSTIDWSFDFLNATLNRRRRPSRLRRSHLSKKSKKKKNGIAKSSSTKNEVQGGVNSGSETETPEQENLIMVGGIAGYSEEVDSRLTFDEFRNKTQPKDNTRSTN